MGKINPPNKSYQNFNNKNITTISSNSVDQDGKNMKKNADNKAVKHDEFAVDPYSRINSINQNPITAIQKENIYQSPNLNLIDW